MRGGRRRGSRTPWRERRESYPEGVASGDPTPDSVLLWTRRPFPAGTKAQRLTAEIAADRSFRKVIATAVALISAESDWTCRVLVGGLRPGREYWYRFTSENGDGSASAALLQRRRRAIRVRCVSCS